MWGAVTLSFFSLSGTKRRCSGLLRTGRRSWTMSIVVAGKKSCLFFVLFFLLRVHSIMGCALQQSFLSQGGCCLRANLIKSHSRTWMLSKLHSLKKTTTFWSTCQRTAPTHTENAPGCDKNCRYPGGYIPMKTPLHLFFCPVHIKSVLGGQITSGWRYVQVSAKYRVKRVLKMHCDLITRTTLGGGLGHIPLHDATEIPGILTHFEPSWCPTCGWSSHHLIMLRGAARWLSG